MPARIAAREPAERREPGRAAHDVERVDTARQPENEADRLAGLGEPLEPGLRARFEQGFGAPLGDVRVHRDAVAARSARRLGAAAFTVGRSIFIRPEHYASNSFSSELLLAHELVHAEQHRWHSRSFGASPAGAAEMQARELSHRLLRGHSVAGAALATPAAISLAPETWFRGDVEGAVRPGPGANLHDLGEGLYLSDRQDVAGEYATTRAGEAARRGSGGAGRVRSVTIDRASLGRVLDLTTDSRWNEFIKKPIAGMTPEQLIRRSNENYSRFFEHFVATNKIDLSKYDAIIGSEYVRGGKQICIRNPAKIAEIEKLLTTVPKPPSGGGTSGSREGGKGSKPAPSKPATPDIAKPPAAKPPAAKPPTPTPKAKPPVPVEPHVPKQAPAPKAPRPSFSFKRPVYASTTVRVGAQIGASVGTSLLLGWMWDAMKKSAAETPAPKREIKEAGSFLRAIRKPDALKLADLIGTTTHEYANGGFAEERAAATLAFFAAYARIDAIRDQDQRRAALYELLTAAIGSTNDLAVMRTNVDEALKLETEFHSRINDAEALEQAVLYGSAALFYGAGIPVEDISRIMSNLKSYAATFRVTLEGLKKLRGAINEAHDADWRLVGKLKAAYERGSLTGGREGTEP